MILREARQGRTQRGERSHLGVPQSTPALGEEDPPEGAGLSECVSLQKGPSREAVGKRRGRQPGGRVVQEHETRQEALRKFRQHPEQTGLFPGVGTKPQNGFVGPGQIPHPRKVLQLRDRQAPPGSPQQSQVARSQSPGAHRR